MIIQASKSHEEIKYYKKILQAASALSKLFSENTSPLLYYRIVENSFVKAFNANDHARDDISFDASKNGIGYGIKTFVLSGGSTSQKIAEFDEYRSQISQLAGMKKANEIADHRNKRLKAGMELIGIKKSYFHCIARQNNKVFIHEEPIDFINYKTLKVIRETPQGISFTDGLSNYNYNNAKSTLSKTFQINKDDSFDVKIYDNPFLLLEKLIDDGMLEIVTPTDHEFEQVYLPLYSTTLSKPGNKVVAEKSGLNQWNAGGRDRNSYEVYIPVPKKIHEVYPNFFPDRGVEFKLKLPNQKVINASICQSGDKAIMSNPNKDLGYWLLNDVLNFDTSKKVPVEYNDLLEIGIDSVSLIKKSDNEFEINFNKINSYEMFHEDILSASTTI